MARKRNVKVQKKAGNRKKVAGGALLREMQRKQWAKWIAIAVTVIFIITTFLAFGAATFK